MDELKRVEQIQEIQIQFTALTQKLYDLIKHDEPSLLKKYCLEYLQSQGHLNSEYSIKLLMLIPSIAQKEKFKKIIKPLEDDIKGEQK